MTKNNSLIQRARFLAHVLGVEDRYNWRQKWSDEELQELVRGLERRAREEPAPSKRQSGVIQSNVKTSKRRNGLFPA